MFGCIVTEKNISIGLWFFNQMIYDAATFTARNNISNIKSLVPTLVSLDFFVIGAWYYSNQSARVVGSHVDCDFSLRFCGQMNSMKQKICISKHK